MLFTAKSGLQLADLEDRNCSPDIDGSGQCQSVSVLCSRRLPRDSEQTDRAQILYRIIVFHSLKSIFAPPEKLIVSRLGFRTFRRCIRMTGRRKSLNRLSILTGTGKARQDEKRRRGYHRRIGPWAGRNELAAAFADQREQSGRRRQRH